MNLEKWEIEKLIEECSVPNHPMHVLVLTTAYFSRTKSTGEFAVRYLNGALVDFAPKKLSMKQWARLLAIYGEDADE